VKTMSHLTLPDLVQALERHPERHHAFDVFADDVRELRALRDTGALPPGWLPLDEGGRRFAAQHEGHAYEVELFPRSGVVRLQRAPETAPQEGVLATGALARDIAGAAIDEANERKGDWWMPELVLGLLVGDRVGAAETPEGVRALPRRVFPLHYDLTDKAWVYYGGGLMPWMKTQLLDTAA